MRCIGLIGGTSWESTAVYYRLLNEGVRARLGGLHSARLVLVSVDFAPLADAMADGRWDVVTAILVEAAGRLEAAGAEIVGLCTNTMHKVADALATPLPFADIRDCTGDALAARGVRRPLLLATSYTMEQPFYRQHLAERSGAVVCLPDPDARTRLQAIIFDELCRGVVSPASKAKVLAMVAAAEGCDSVILGCTEIGLLLSPADIPVPVFDTTVLHCEALLDFALAETPVTSIAA